MGDQSWNIRFGQILRHRLEALDRSQPGRFTTRLQDVLYFHPEEREIIRRAAPGPTPYQPLDLNVHVDLYRKYFTAPRSPRPSPVDEALAKRLDTTFLVIPGLPQESLLATPIFESARRTLEAQGLSVRALSFSEEADSYRSAAREIAGQIESMKDLAAGIVLIGHSHGAAIALALLEERAFRAMRPKVRAFVSLAGSLRTPDAAFRQELRACASDALEIFRTVRGQQKPTLEARLVKSLRSMLDRDIPWASGIREVLDRLERLRADMVEIPKGFEKWMYGPPQEAEVDACPKDIAVFTLTALCPRETLCRGELLPNNLDDLFLHLCSRPLYTRAGPFTDAHLPAPDQDFPDESGAKNIHLGTLRSDHWGAAIPRVLSLSHEDPFPRTALLESVILTVDQFLREGTSN